ncbi:DUF4232 domain-containing protein [Kitasatospora sp. NPDC052896]|uniref:DUF4232 domain-containing protein n=1 Tax=Kitasatospora sp. NPDC052896 TaxID=3364061 RepID=UPI0037CB7181
MPAMPVETAHRRRALARRALLPGVVAAVALTATACSSSSPTPAGAPSAAAPAGTTPAASPLAPGTAAPSAPVPGTGPAAPAIPAPTAPATAPGAPASSAAAVGGSTRACTSSQLSAVLANPGVGAGQYYATLVFTNTSAANCTLTGYPGVSYVATNGVQSGNAAVRDTGTVATVTLRPGGRASAVLHDSNGVGGYDPTQCQLAPAQGLRIYPPNETAALFVPWQTQHCAGPTIHALSIGPVQQD